MRSWPPLLAGEGSQLLRALQVEWERRGAVVLLHPANEPVADFTPGTARSRTAVPVR